MGSFSVVHWLIALGIFFLIYKIVRGIYTIGKVSDTGSMVCQNCGTRGEPKTIIKGSIAIEIVLWLCFILPGLIYSLWRLTTKQPGCPACGQTSMIGITTPKGRQLIENQRV